MRFPDLLVIAASMMLTGCASGPARTLLTSPFGLVASLIPPAPPNSTPPVEVVERSLPAKRTEVFAVPIVAAPETSSEDEASDPTADQPKERYPRGRA